VTQISAGPTGFHFGITPSSIRITVCTMNRTTWPADLILDLRKSNWIEWSRTLKLHTL
jgi:hypothetical protein